MISHDSNNSEVLQNKKGNVCWKTQVFYESSDDKGRRKPQVRSISLPYALPSDANDDKGTLGGCKALKVHK